MEVRRQALWQGPYAEWPPEVGQWVMFVMPEWVKIGKIVRVEGISLVVAFEAHSQPTVIPDAYSYWDYYGVYPHPPYSLVPTLAPKHTVAPVYDERIMSVRQAASLLGKTPKDIRRMIRGGQIQGERVKGTWVVLASSLSRRSQEGRRDTD